MHEFRLFACRLAGPLHSTLRLTLTHGPLLRTLYAELELRPSRGGHR